MERGICYQGCWEVYQVGKKIQICRKKEEDFFKNGVGKKIKLHGTLYTPGLFPI